MTKIRCWGFRLLNDKRRCAEYPDEYLLDNEIALRPLKEHLLWMLKNFNKCKEQNSVKNTNTNTKRHNLRNNHQETLDEAKSYIEEIYSKSTAVPKAWYILEGNTYPDIFIETKEHIIVIKEKGTERSATMKTYFLDDRNQMVRHIQGAMQYNEDHCNGEKTVMGFYIVDEQEFIFDKNKHIKSFSKFEDVLKIETVPCVGSETVKKCFKGYTTWQKIKEQPEFSDIVFPTKEDIN